MRDETLNLLQQARDVGGVDLSIGEGADPTIAAAIRNAQDILPTDWLTASNDQGELYLKESASRGSYKPDRFSGDGFLAMRPAADMTQDDYNALTAHEFGHRVEDSTDGVWLMEKQFYDARTAGEDFVVMPDSFGVQAQRTKEDRWANTYVGREPIVVARPGTLDAAGNRLRTYYSYEILSSGLEWVVGNNPIYAYWLTQDEEFHRFILGILFGAKDHAI